VKAKKGRSILTIILSVILSLLTGVSACADSGTESPISDYNVKVRINTDGSIDVTENIRYSSLSGYNNILLLLDKKEGEEFEIKNVYMLQKEGYIECTRLESEQWDISAFSGTYSVIEEPDMIRLKVYGTFSRRYGSIVVQYSVKNAVRRYNDVAEFRRTHIFKKWGEHISNISINVDLPLKTSISQIKPFLHGVIVGYKKVQDSSITFIIPNTVPGEYVETRIVFPQDLIFNAPFEEAINHLPKVMEEEEEYNESDKSDLLKAREDAAKEAGRKAWAQKMTQRAKKVAAGFSLIASILGIYMFIRLKSQLGKIQKTPIPMNLKGIDELSPAEARMIVFNGRTGARAVLGSLFKLVSLGRLTLGVSENGHKVMTFKINGDINGDINEGINDSNLKDSDYLLLEWLSGMTDNKNEFNPVILTDKARRTASASDLRTFLDQWEHKVFLEYSDRDILGTTLLFYRDLGLIIGAVLFFLGCIIPVSLSIWTGYLMLPVGFALFLYSLRIRKHTHYGVAQHRIWKELKKRLINRTIALDGLPDWMSKAMALLGYTVALGTEKELSLVYAALTKENNNLSVFLDNNREDRELSGIIKNTIAVFDQAIREVQDANQFAV